MTPTAWIEWSTKQMADLGVRLWRQGYSPKRIKGLCDSVPEFGTRFRAFEADFQGITDAMTTNPDGYHHFDSMTRIKQELLVFTNFNRARFLSQPAKIA